MCLFCHCQILCFAFHSSQKFKNLTHSFYFSKTYNQTNKKPHIEANFEAFFKTNRSNFLLIVFFLLDLTQKYCNRESDRIYLIVVIHSNSCILQGYRFEFKQMTRNSSFDCVCYMSCNFFLFR